MTTDKESELLAMTVNELYALHPICEDTVSRSDLPWWYEYAKAQRAEVDRLNREIAKLRAELEQTNAELANVTFGDAASRRIAAVERETIERCAKVCDTEAQKMKDRGDIHAYSCHLIDANAIRALAQPEQGAATRMLNARWGSNA